tara:strand:- start:6531 stop:7289 length:759 start_codon:yes stop_codon:yes gene_type:complete
MRYGADGYAIYWYCLELIAGDLGTTEEINFELAHDAEVIGFNLKVDSSRVEEIMRYIVNLGLFENNEGTISCIKLAKYLDKKTTRNKRIHQIIDAANALQGDGGDCPRLSGTVPDNSGRSPDSGSYPQGRPPVRDKESIVADKSQYVPDGPPTVRTCPDLSPLDTDTDTDTDTLPDPVGSGRERAPAPVKYPLPLDFTVSDSMRQWAADRGINEVEIQMETEKFMDHHRAKGEPCADWESQWRMWMHRFIER